MTIGTIGHYRAPPGTIGVAPRSPTIGHYRTLSDTIGHYRGYRGYRGYRSYQSYQSYRMVDGTSGNTTVGLSNPMSKDSTDILHPAYWPLPASEPGVKAAWKAANAAGLPAKAVRSGMGGIGDWPSVVAVRRKM